LGQVHTGSACELEHVRGFLTESKTAYFSLFFTFFQLRSFGYAPSKRQKLTKNLPVFAIGRKPRTCSERAGAKKRFSGCVPCPIPFFCAPASVTQGTIPAWPVEIFLKKQDYYAIQSIYDSRW
jgi:hypothetical protein